MKVGKYLVISLLFVYLLTGAVLTNASPANYWDDNSNNLDNSFEPISGKRNTTNYSLAPGDPVDLDAAQVAGADYLRKMQADITEDNAGNGNPDVPDDPDDGGWDWAITTFSHSVGSSATNIYGATVMGVYYTYLETGDPALFTVMQDAADRIVSTGPSINRSGADMKFLLLFNELYNAEVSITTVYADAAKAKYDLRLSSNGGTATSFAEYLRDIRGVTQGYSNGIIGWDLGIYAVVAQKLFGIYGTPYDSDADDIAEVLWQDSYNNNPGLFDVVADAGFDSTWADKNFWWYTLGITGLIDAFDASGSHTSEISGLVTRLLASQYSGGGISGSYGANTNDEDWQSTGYTMMTLGNLDQATYQININKMGYWLGATQDVSGGWVYGSGNHYPEIGGECTAGLYFTTNVNSDVIVDDNFASQADVDIYNTANSTSYVWGYNAFATIQAAIDAVNGSTVFIANGSYLETLSINKPLTLTGESEAGVVINIPPAGGYGILVTSGDVLMENFTLATNATNENFPIHASGTSNPPNGFTNLTLQNITISNAHRRTGFDIHGYNNVLLTNLTSQDAWGGNGLQITGCIDVVINNITTSGNAWGSMAIYSSGPSYLNRGSDNVTIDGNTLSLGEGVLFNQDEFGLTNTNITVIGYEFMVRNLAFRPDASGFYFYLDTYADAVISALGLEGIASGSFIISLTSSELFVADGMTIQAAIDAADPGGIINVGAGTYNERPIANKSVSIIGADEATVIVDAGAATSGSYGFSVTANDVSISNLTLVGNPLVSVPRYGFKPSNVSNFTLENVTGKEFYRTAVDLLGVTNGILTNVSSLDNNGHGISLVDCNTVLLTDITVSGNAWQGVSVATWGNFSPLGTSGIVFTGTNSFVDPFQLEEGDFNNPGIAPAGDAIITYSTNIGDGADVTVQAADFSFAVHGTQDDSPSQNRIWFMSSLVNATVLVAAAPIGHFTGVDMYIEDIVDLTQLYVSPGGTIQAAIDAADSGDDVNILAGTYAEGPQIHVDKSLALTGQGSVTITPIANTGSSGDARGWFLVDAGVLLDFSNVTLDGAGFNIYQGIRSRGGGTYDNILFQNFVHPGYQGVGLAVFGSENVSITNCIFTNMGRIGALLFGSGLTDSYFMNNTYTGKGDGDWLDYAADISAGAVVTVDSCIITNCTGVASSDGSTSAGLLVSTYFGGGTTASITNTILNGNTTGIAVGYDNADESIVNAHNNSIANNTSYGISTSGPLVVVNAENNYWGALDGPLDAAGTMEAVIGGTCYTVGDITNQVAEGFPGDGLGNQVSEGVMYCPWIATDVFMSPGDIVYMCDGDFEIDVAINPSITNMKSVSIRLSYPASLQLGSVVLSDANYANAPIFVWDNATGYDSVQVDMFVQSGLIDGFADLFTISFNGVSDICTTDMISMTRAVWKAGVSNDEIIAAVANPITITADCADPVVTINSPVDGGFYNSTPILNVSTSDNCDIDFLYYQVDTDGWIAILSSYVGNSYSNATWQLTSVDFDNLTEAAHCIQFKVVDDLGREGLSTSWCFTKDITAPAAPTDFAAEPGHNKVKLNWTNSSSSDVVGVQIQRNAWGDYPTYDTPAPAYPTAYNDGTSIFGGTGSSITDLVGLNNSTRDIYYYSAFAYDAAGNYSAAIPAAQARATSYWLGDVSDNIFTLGNYDGFIHVGDLTVFATTYWKTTGDAGFIDECDFGPTIVGTDNGALNAARGIPLPDDSISFTDLGIFAINYQSVDNVMKAVPLFTDKSINGSLYLSLEPTIEGNVVTCDLDLNNNNDESKIIHISFEYSDNLVYKGYDNKVGEVVGNYPIFAKARNIGHRIEFDLALMGRGASISGSGNLVSFKFELIDDNAVNFNFVEGLVFDNNLEEISSELLAGKIDFIPETYVLEQNYPNPFNPSTEISYQLPNAGKVTLEIFNLLGQKVITLIDREQEANSYQVSWDGQNESGVKVTSGVYLYRLKVNNFVQTRKMILLK